MTVWFLSPAEVDAKTSTSKILNSKSSLAFPYTIHTIFSRYDASE